MTGSLTDPPVKVLRQLLVDNSLGTLPSAAGNWPIGIGESMGTPDNEIFLSGTESLLEGRNPHDRYFWERYGVQIMVRASRYETGWTKAEALKTTLDEISNNSVVIDTVNYGFYVFHRTGGVLHLGKEPGTTRHRFSINGLATIRQL